MLSCGKLTFDGASLVDVGFLLFQHFASLGSIGREGLEFIGRTINFLLLSLHLFDKVLQLLLLSTY